MIFMLLSDSNHLSNCQGHDHCVNHQNVSEPILSFFVLCRRKPSPGTCRFSDAIENSFGLLWFVLFSFNLD